MTSFTCIHQNTIAFIPIGGNVLVSRNLVLFLKKQGLDNDIAARAINKTYLFNDNLVSSCHSVHKSPRVIGEELTTQISEAVLPCPKSLHEDHGGILVDVTENFPHLPDTEREVVPLPATQQCGRFDYKKLKAVSRVSEAGPCGSLPPHIIYLLEFGLDLEQIKVMAQKYPHFAYLSLEGKIRPLAEFLLDLGVSESDLPIIVARNPQLCGLSLSKNIIPKMAFLETLGVDKTKWAKVISRFPPFLCLSRQKVEATVEFLYEMGLSEESIGKLLTRFPVITGLSIEDQLRSKAEYFRSLGVDVAALLQRGPHIMGLSMETKLKPVTEFFLENGFSIEEVGSMISKHAALYSYSLTANLVPKWAFFSTTGYPKQDLVKFPQYFSYSFEERIKPRYNLMKESGAKLSLSQLLIRNHHNFELLLKKKIEKLQSDELCN